MHYSFLRDCSAYIIFKSRGKNCRNSLISPDLSFAYQIQISYHFVSDAGSNETIWRNMITLTYNYATINVPICQDGTTDSVEDLSDPLCQSSRRHLRLQRSCTARGVIARRDHRRSWQPCPPRLCELFSPPSHFRAGATRSGTARHLCREALCAFLRRTSGKRNATPRRSCAAHLSLSRSISSQSLLAALRAVTLRTCACPSPSPPVPLCIFPLVPSRSFARAYQQSILRTWECEMACPAMPAMLLESRCGRVDCLDSLIPLRTSSPCVPRRRTYNHASKPTSPSSPYRAFVPWPQIRARRTLHAETRAICATDFLVKRLREIQ